MMIIHNGALPLLLLLLATLAATDDDDDDRKCYYPDGSISTRDAPCSSSGATHCCGRTTGICLDSGYCIDFLTSSSSSSGGGGSSPGLYRGSCTDGTWGEACPQHCVGGTDDPGEDARVVPWKAAADGRWEYCCLGGASSSDAATSVCADGGVPFVLDTGAMVVGFGALAGGLSSTTVMSDAAAAASTGTEGGRRGGGSASLSLSSSSSSSSSVAAFTSSSAPSPDDEQQQPSGCSSRSPAVAIVAGLGASLCLCAVAAAAWAALERRRRIREREEGIVRGGAAAAAAKTKGGGGSSSKSASRRRDGEGKKQLEAYSQPYGGVLPATPPSNKDPRRARSGGDGDV